MTPMPAEPTAADVRPRGSWDLTSGQLLERDAISAAVKPFMLRTAKEAHKRYIPQMGSADPRDVSALAALVQRVVDDSGDPVGFNALAWTTRWLHRPVPALGGACPAEYMATPESRSLVETLIMRMQSGAYS
jgi:uncharacterized protein (DUF2384 family)